MTEDPNLRERIAVLETEVAYLARATKDVPEVAAAAGRQGAISYEEGLKESFIKDTKATLARFKLWLVALSVAFVMLAGYVGLKAPLLIP